MFGKRSALIISITLSMLANGILLILAPSIKIFDISDLPETLKTFKVALAEKPLPPTRTFDDSEALVSKPGSIEDLLKRHFEELKPKEPTDTEPLEIPDISERLSSEKIEREYDLEATPNLIERIDAKIIEISENNARQDIEIARRLVRPSPSRILAPDEFPTLRGLPGEWEEDVLLIPGSGSPQGTGGTGADAKADAAPRIEEPEKPRYETNLVEPESTQNDEAPKELSFEKIALSEPIVREVIEESEFEFIDDLVDIELDAFTTSANGDEGFFRLRIVPKADKGIESLPKRITYVVDASASISQRKLDKTATALKRMVSMLRPVDQFNIVIFRGSATHFRGAPVPATEAAKKAAHKFLSGLKSGGETDVYKAIRPVVETELVEGTPNVIVLISDGRPTQGLKDARAIINSLTSENQERIPIFALGGGRTVNRYLLDLLAYRNKGESFVTPQIEDIDDALPAFFSRFNEPLLVNLQADYGRIDSSEVYPQEIPDFYKGRPVTIYGRFKPDTAKEFVVRITGLSGPKKKELVFRANLQEAATGNEDISRDWAFRKIYHIIGQICQVGETPELLKELSELSRKYNIKTSYSN